MADFIDEVNDELRHERVMQFWKKAGGYFIVGAIIVIAATAGNVLWKNHKETQNEASTALLIQADEVRDAKEWEKAAADYNQMAEKNTSGIGGLAKLQQAAMLGKAGKNKEAVASYTDLANDVNAEAALRDMAALRGASLLIAEKKKENFSVIQNLLKPVSDNQKSALRFLAKEQLAYAALVGNDPATARSLLSEIAESLGAEETLRNRARAALATLPTIVKK